MLVGGPPGLLLGVQIGSGAGTLVGTYQTGLVNQNDLCHLGGWPGEGLMEVFGLWHEDTDALFDGEQNTLCLKDGRSYPLKELCALIHTRGAQVLGTYGEDFYKGEPAFTVNRFGKGRAYYIASFAGDGFYLDFYRQLCGELSLPQALEELPPQGVEACLRENGEEQFLFLQNFSGEPQQVALPQGYGTWEGQPAGQAALASYDSQVFLHFL